MLKKIISFILLLFLLISQANAYIVDKNSSNPYFREKISTQIKLSSIKNWGKYINIINKFIKKASSEKLNKILKRINNAENKIYSKKDFKKYKKVLLIIKYIKYSILFELENRKKLEEQKKLESIKKENLSLEEQKKVETKILSIQKNLSSLIENTINFSKENLEKNIEKLTNYEEKGNSSLKILIDEKSIWKIKAELDLKNYNLKNSTFNQDFKWQINALINASLNWEEDFKLQLSTFLNYIEKDWSAYLLLKGLNLVTNQKEFDQFKDKIEKLKKLAEENKYIKIEDYETKTMLDMLKKINTQKINNDIEKSLSKPLLKAYKKENNKYYLVPTKFACDTFKKLNNSFDPINWKTCSNSQYNDLLKNFIKIWDLYLELWTKNKLVFEWKPDQIVKNFNSYIIFDDRNIEKIYSKLETNNKEWSELNYIKNNKLDFTLNAQDKLKINLKSSLDYNNTFKKIDFEILSKWFNNENLNVKLKLENKKLNWKIEYNYRSFSWYDKETWEPKYTNYNLIANIYWEQGYKNNLKNLKIDTNIKNKETNFVEFKANFEKQDSNYNLEIENYNSKKEKSFETKINLKNSKISWKTIFYDNNKQFITITHSWEYATNYINLKNKIDFSKDLPLLWWYNNQISNSRDSIRISDLKFIESAVEQYYQDNWEYPKKITKDSIWIYISKIPKDPLWNVEINSCKFGYIYEVWEDKNWIPNQNYKLSACLENTKKAEIDGWTDNKRIEFWFLNNSYKNKQYINNYKTWIKKEIKKEKKENKKINSNLNISVDTRNNKNNFNLYFDYNKQDKKVIEIEITNKWTIEYKKVEIKAPKNYVDEKTLELWY